MQQGSFWNRNAAVALILAAAAIISLVYLLSSGTDEEQGAPEGDYCISCSRTRSRYFPSRKK